MRYFFLLIMTVSLTSCFVFDKIPSVKIEIEETALPEIDSIFLINSPNNNSSQLESGRKVTSGQRTYFLYPIYTNSRIKILLTNSKVIFSDSTFIVKPSSEIRISKNNGAIEFNKNEKTQAQRYIFLFISIFLIVIITKVPIATLISKPHSKWRFMILYTGLNLIYVLMGMFFMFILEDIFAIMLYLLYLIVIGSDIIFFKKQNQDTGLVRPLIAGIVSNFIFLTIGQFTITYAIMTFS